MVKRHSSGTSDNCEIQAEMILAYSTQLIEYGANAYPQFPSINNVLPSSVTPQSNVHPFNAPSHSVYSDTAFSLMRKIYSQQHYLLYRPYTPYLRIQGLEPIHSLMPSSITCFIRNFIRVIHTRTIFARESYHHVTLIMSFY